MGIVSNWPASLEATLEAAGIKQYFEVIVASGVVGYAKPHPAIFHMALSQMGVEPRDTLFVGDKFNLDIDGAATVGMPSVLIDRNERFPEHQERVLSLQELLAYVA
jgi:HAD superfamily hydrolase (TIGR01549 family)